MSSLRYHYANDDVPITTNFSFSVNKLTTVRFGVQIKKIFLNLHLKELQFQYLLSKADITIKAAQPGLTKKIANQITATAKTRP